MTYYEELDVSPHASADEIRHTHKNLARLFHPDQFADPEQKRLAESQMKRINSVYSVLNDPARRRLYDQQLAVEVQERPAGLVQWKNQVRRYGGWMVAAVGLGAGIFGLTRPPAEKIVYVDRPGQGTDAGKSARLRPPPAERTDPNPGEQLRQLVRETRELSQTLDQAIVERDQALAHLSALRSTPALSNVAPVNDPPAHAPSQPLLATPTRDAGKPRRLSGTWIYVPTSKPSPNDLYPAEYIELVLTENDTHLWGRYRARYRVPDQALSPAVEFQFEGRAGSTERYAWSGNGGARGEVRLKLLSENSLSVDWFTSQLGRALSLSSGTAVLVRRQE